MLRRLTRDMPLLRSLRLFACYSTKIPLLKELKPDEHDHRRIEEAEEVLEQTRAPLHSRCAGEIRCPRHERVARRGDGLRLGGVRPVSEFKFHRYLKVQSVTTALDPFADIVDWLRYLTA